MLTNSKKFSTIAAVIVIAAFSIFAAPLTFQSTNQTHYQETVTLNLQGGGQIPVQLAPGQSVPTQLNGNSVVGITLFGAFVPAGANAVIPSPNGNVDVIWQMAGGSAIGMSTVPDGGTIS